MMLRMLGSLYQGRITRMATGTGRMRSVDLGTVCFRPLRSPRLACGAPIKMAGMQKMLDMS